jgi:prefoldin subunit 5
VLEKRIAELEKKVDMLESLEVKYIEEIQELHDRITDLKAI